MLQCNILPAMAVPFLMVRCLGPMVRFKVAAVSDNSPQYLIGIGAQKCASSWLHAVGGAHPAVVSSDPKEVDFFSYFFDRGYRWYEGHFDAAGARAVRFDNSPSYFYDPRSPGRVAAFSDGARVVALLRDPIKRAFSNHLHEIIKGHIPRMTFEEGLENNPVYLDQGRYATHLARWFDALPRERVLVMFAEEISADPDGSAATLYRFAGVDPKFQSAVAGERRNESDRARFPLLRTSLRAGGDWLRRRGLEEQLAAVKQLSPIAAALKANSVNVKDEVPPMRAETEARLRDVFADEVARLPALLGRADLPWSDWALEPAA